VGAPAQARSPWIAAHAANAMRRADTPARLRRLVPRWLHVHPYKCHRPPVSPAACTRGPAPCSRRPRSTHSRNPQRDQSEQESCNDGTMRRAPLRPQRAQVTRTQLPWPFHQAADGAGMLVRSHQLPGAIDFCSTQPRNADQITMIAVRGVYALVCTLHLMHVGTRPNDATALPLQDARASPACARWVRP